MRSAKYLIALVVLVSAVALQAQPPPPMGPMGGPMGGPMRERVRERIRTMKVWKLTEYVGLTAEQSEKFFPIYNKYQKALDEIDSKRMDLVDRLGKLVDTTGASDKDIEIAMAALNDIPNQIISEREKFFKEISPILPLEQQAKLAVFEERFKQQLQQFIREIRRDDNRGGGMRNN